ncbi:rhomboid-domain-containing protein [Exidia glandulosa HHB12029]|uniref:Rhomboid-domain-containing protein n=1 Tax=Exidia glandulosa HHB12029 TaxID=1314781 RepID=A0A165QQA9_EXIGL|nr:rhomboid-domain-containing protein [Exidia glandulosa HHB12029]
MLHALPRIARPCIARPLYRAATFRPSPLLARPLGRSLSSVRLGDWRLLRSNWRGGADTSVASTDTSLKARRIPRHDVDNSNRGGPAGYPESKAKLFIYAILAVNGVVFVGWYMAQNTYNYEKNPRPLAFMFANFTSSVQNIQGGRYWTLVTSCFSHQAPIHLLMNSLAIYWMAPTVLQLLGPVPFMTFYIATGVAANVLSLVWKSSMSSRENRWSLGASGCGLGVFGFFATIFPKAPLNLYGLIPVPAWLAVGGFFAFDLWQATQPKSLFNFDSAAHVGGVACGVAYGLLKRRGYRRFMR